jgi:hypothetical protein
MARSPGVSTRTIDRSGGRRQRGGPGVKVGEKDSTAGRPKPSAPLVKTKEPNPPKKDEK